MKTTKTSWLTVLFACCALVHSGQALSAYKKANSLEITPYVGQMYGEDLSSGGNDLNVDGDTSIGLGFAWRDSPNGQGQILINAVSHDFDTNTPGSKGSMDIIHAHFNGVAQFRHVNYVTTVSIGLGGSMFDVDQGHDAVYPSVTAALGTRYELSKSLALVTELRGYAALTDEDDDLFCQGATCVAEFDSAVWMQTNISLGIAYSF